MRLIVGYGFVAHGCAKIVNGPAHFAASLQALGEPDPDLMTWATIDYGWRREREWRCDSLDT